MKLIIITKIIKIFCNFNTRGIFLQSQLMWSAKKKIKHFDFIQVICLAVGRVIINIRSFQNHQAIKEQAAVLIIAANLVNHIVSNQPMIRIYNNFLLPKLNLNRNLLLFCAWPGALLGGTWSCAGESGQQQQQRSRQDGWLPEPGPGDLTAEEGVQDGYKHNYNSSPANNPTCWNFILDIKYYKSLGFTWHL